LTVAAVAAVDFSQKDRSKPRMTPITDCIIEDPRWDAFGLEPLAETVARATLGSVGLATDGYEIAILACDDARISALNADFRGKPVPTNVLSWPSDDRNAKAPGILPDLPQTPTALGDIAIAFDTCAREAADQGKTMQAHVTHLIVHGILHLLGFDHIDDANAALMESTETCILASLGVSDPY
jgi:probable rRNA maturation factor